MRRVFQTSHSILPPHISDERAAQCRQRTRQSRKIRRRARPLNRQFQGVHAKPWSYFPRSEFSGNVTEKSVMKHIGAVAFPRTAISSCEPAVLVASRLQLHPFSRCWFTCHGLLLTSRPLHNSFRFRPLNQFIPQISLLYIKITICNLLNIDVLCAISRSSQLLQPRR